MIVGMGVDLVASRRVQKMVKRWGDRFLHRVFTPLEIHEALKQRDSSLFLSARFAVKEATLKALGIGVRMGIRWPEIETVHDPLGKPMVRLHGRAKAIAQEKQISNIVASISHEKEYACAVLLMERMSDEGGYRGGNKGIR